jgi:predicted ATP-grasp superfamily ATP-dependent carboligase
MRDALLRDLAELDEVEVIIAYDTRLSPPLAHHAIPITDEDDVWQIWGQCIAEADAVWPIAPETGGILLRLTALVNNHRKRLLGSSAEAIELTSSKYATWQALQAAGINTVMTHLPERWIGNPGTAWVVKPDDGVGCEGSMIFATSQALLDWLAQGRGGGHIIQPFSPGIPASLSLLCGLGQAVLLSCNRQKVSLESGSFSYSGSVVNGMFEHWDAFEALAQQVVRTIPGLAGYVGVDVLVDQEQVRVLEINPRLTTSYVGLQEAMGFNPARLIVDLLYNHGSSFAGFSMPQPFLRNVVDVTLNEN